MHIRVGAWIDPTIDGVPVILHIVGRTIEPDNNGDVLDFGMDALPAANAVGADVLQPGAQARASSADAARATLLRASDDRLDVQVAANPPAGSGSCAW